MRVQDRGTVTPRDVEHAAAERGLETGTALERRDLDPALDELVRPRPGIVQATHGHRDLRMQSLRELDDEPLGAARIQTEDDLQHAGPRRHWIHPCRR